MIGQTPVFSVSDFVAVFNHSISTIYPEVVIVGEVSNFRLSKNTWVYFDLKDSDASVKFFGSSRTLPGPVEEGMLAEVYGRPVLHPLYGFSINFYALKLVGEGSINKSKQLLLAKLEKEGLFDENRKRQLPYAPEKIAIISSAESAGYGDFIKVSKARWPSLVSKLYDVKVQGIGAEVEIVSALEQANQSDAEAIVIIRGGGSKDDLALFDNEQLARAVAGSRIPTIVAIGHERDISLCELASDVRASTPSNAAEILVPDARLEKALLKSYLKQANNFVVSKLDSSSKDISTIKALSVKIIKEKIDKELRYVTSSGLLINAYDPKLPLKKGYALVKTRDKIIKRYQQAIKESNVDLEFLDGKVKVIIDKENSHG